MRNTLKGYRLKLGMTQKDMALFLCVPREHYNKWENQKMQPDVGSLYWIWQRLKTKLPDINLQDLLNPE